MHTPENLGIGIPGAAIPQQRFTALDRPRLFPPELPGGGIAPITLFAAPAGMGKTVLASQWVRSRALAGMRVRWVRASESGSGPGELWRAIREALAGAEVCDEHAVSGAGRLIVAQERAAAQREAAALTAPTMLVIDDFQRLTRPQLDVELSELPELSSMLFLTVLSRRFTALDGPLVAARSTVALLSGDYFAFSREEVRELAERLGITGGRLIDDMHEDAAGWPYAVRLMLHAIGSGATQTDLRALMDRFAFDYAERALTPLGLRALYAAALCELISVELLSETIGLPYAETAAIVDSMTELGLVVRQWYPGGARIRCHPGFAQSLEWRARREFESHEIRALRHQHAIEVSHDEPAFGIRSLIALRAFEDASHALVAVFPEELGPDCEAIEPLHRVPLEELHRFPILLGAHLLAENHRGNVTAEEAAALRTALRAAVGDGPEESDPQRFYPAQAMLLAAECLEGHPELLPHARDLAHRLEVEYAAVGGGARHETQLHRALPFIHSTVAAAALTAGDLDLAGRAFHQALEWAELLGIPAKQHHAQTGLAAVAAINGETRRARGHLRAAEELALLVPAEQTAVGSLNEQVARALIAAEQRDTSGLERLLDGLDPMRGHILEWPYLALAEAEITRGRAGNLAAVAGVDARIRESETFFPRAGSTRVVLEAYAAQTMATVGNYRDAAARLDALPAEQPDVRLGRARLALLAGDPERAEEITTALLETRLTVWVRLAVRLVRAAALEALGDPEAADADFATAAEAIRKQETYSALELIPFEMLEAFARRGLHPAVRELAPVIAALPEEVRCAPHEPLTEAEQRMLEAVAATDAPLPAVAEALFVTPHTVKFHLRGVYRKLGVSGREAAVLRAREVGLLPEA
ncbi:LuxR C-terminal-related transcriptional regulator [Leucobacter sp. PH1c]|uniref:LuxR C-terminal-related transcriptional regulator n=1 Tax=Leucobacter sp. PH1c TaxID=1397278 RepID=UPI00046AD062|nr:LuxR C-terminal-related transcriptional regulator [Leucobacter sp. PH1c]